MNLQSDIQSIKSIWIYKLAYISTSYNLVMMLKYYLSANFSCFCVHVHITVDVIVANLEGKFQLSLNINNTWMGSEEKGL